MFDTIKLHLPFYLDVTEMDRVSWTKTNSTLEHRQGSVRTWFKHHTSGMNNPRLIYRYTDDPKRSTSLKIEVSIPKFLYGNNVEQFHQRDIGRFFMKLRDYIANLLNLPVERIPDLQQAETEKLHVCYNFEVGHMKNVYLRALSKVTVPHYECNTYGNGTSVVWKAKTRKVKFYDKLHELQCNMNMQEQLLNEHLLQRAQGILRYEIELSDKEIREKSQVRAACELLDFDWATEVLEGWLRKIGFHNEIGIFPLEYWVNLVEMNSGFTNDTKKALIAYISRLAIHGKRWVQENYATNTYKRHRNDIKSLVGVRELQFSDVYVPPLHIDADTLRERKYTPFWTVQYDMFNIIESFITGDRIVTSNINTYQPTESAFLDTKYLTGTDIITMTFNDDDARDYLSHLWELHEVVVAGWTPNPRLCNDISTVRVPPAC